MERVQSDFMEARDEQPAPESTKEPTWEEKIIKFIKGLVGWVPLIFMMILPKYAGYAIGYAVALGWSVLLLFYQYYCYRTGSVKIFPKMLDIGMALISLALLITEVTAHPGDYFHWFVAGIIVDSALAGIVLISILLQNSFTLQFAKENIPQDKWDNPMVLKACQITAFLWFGMFVLMVISQIIPIATHATYDDTISIIFGTVGPVVIVVVGFRLTDKLQAYFKAKRKQHQQNQGVNINN